MHLEGARQVANWANLSTPVGLLVARLGGGSVVRAPRGIWVATHVRSPLLRAHALTLGSVVLTPHSADWLQQRPRLQAHEERHAWQYVVCFGLPMLPMYAVAAGVSWVWCRNPGTRNPFELLAGLADGGYPVTPAQARARYADRRTRRGARA
ncbi:MAG TPA: hypothetical protein VFJ14_05740 [Nocardioidaceae bacterium]|nr:hypothetical protein [Nocardioidaceae bacterium]